MTKLKAKAVKNRLGKYNVIVDFDGRKMPIGKTFDLETYKILDFETKEQAIEHILDWGDRLELVK